MFLGEENSEEGKFESVAWELHIYGVIYLFFLSSFLSPFFLLYVCLGSGSYCSGCD